MRTIRSISLPALALLLAPLAAEAQSGYTITDLGSLYGNSGASGVNNSGQVVGTYYTKYSYASYLYSSGSLTDLGSPGGFTVQPNHTYSSPNAINDSGQIVGEYTYNNGHDTMAGAYLYQNGQIQAINMDEAKAINNAGQIVGSDRAGNAALYQNGVTTAIKVGAGASANAINSFGQIAGGDGLYAFLYQNGVEQILPPLDGSKGSIGYGLNNSGIVVGASGASDNHGHAVYWKNGVPYNISPSGVNSTALAINNSGLIVGYAGLSNGDNMAFVYQNGQMTDLLAGSIWHDGEATAINDSGQIVGQATLPDGRIHAFLATPNAVPAPGSLLTLGVGAGVMLLAARRRRRNAAARS